MKVLFITAGPETFASSRMRAWWVAEHMPDAKVVTFDSLKEIESLPPADVYIWQKWVNPEMVRAMPGSRHWWDVCDPMWWWQPEECREIAEAMTGVVASNPALTEDFRQWSGKLCHTIPDRLKLSMFPIKREHVEARPVRLIWFGMAINRIALFAAWANIERLAANGYPIELTIFDDRPDDEIRWGQNVPILHTRWHLELENRVLAAHDIALLPPYPGPWGRVKSNNKNLTAWACGLPTMTGENYNPLELLVLDKDQRAQLALSGHKLVEQDYSVEQSAREWEALLCA